jgi:iron complex outermembrane recepter protein
MTMMGKGWSIQGTLALSLLSSVALPGMAQERSPLAPLRKGGTEPRLEVPLIKGDLGGSQSVNQPTISRLRDLQQPATTVKQWVAQMEAAQVQVTNVKLEPTEAGLDITLETGEGKPLQIDATKFRREGNNLIADIPNAVLALPQGQTFVADNPTADIGTVQVVQQESNIRVSVAGNNALPKTEVTLKTGGLAYSLNPEADEPDEEIVVTGQQDGYRVPNASVGTRTDTPLRDVPQSIQVVPRQVLIDRQSRSILDGLETVSGLTAIASTAGTRQYFTARGFELYSGFLVNGIPDPQIANDSTFINVERLEVLKGPTSVLYGQSGDGSIGATVNVVTRQPLRDPFYQLSTTIGSFNDYEGVFDLSGPLNTSRTVLYRLIAGYRSNETFIDFNRTRTFAIAPSLSFKLGQNTDLILEGDVNILKRGGAPGGVPAVGTVLPNQNGKLRNSLNVGGPQKDYSTTSGRVGYRLEHRFNEDWKLRSAFRFNFYNNVFDSPFIGGSSLAGDNRTLDRFFLIGDGYFNNYFLRNDVVGKFQTGSIEHQLLFGFSLNRSENYGRSEFGSAASIDIFNPVFDQSIDLTGTRDDPTTTRDTLGIFVQDQVALAKNLKLLLGGRVDIFRERTNDRLAEVETTQSDTAFSPRLGIVYQPISAISLYASYSRSFTPTIGRSASGEAFKPGRGTQYEVGVKADLSNQLSATLAFYDLTRSNVTTVDPNDPIFSVQTGRQRSRGIELDISGEILPGWNIIGGYAYTDARVTEDNTIPVGNRLFAAPEHAFNLWTTYRIQNGDLRGLGFGLGFNYVGKVQGNLANTFEVPSFFRTDAAIFYERDRFRASINFRNLFNVEYFTSRGSEVFVNAGEPFSIQGTLSWRF